MYFCIKAKVDRLILIKYANIIKMKKFDFSLLFVITILLLSCEKSVEDPAQMLLAKAKEQYAINDYNRVKMYIDSISVAYPKAYKTRREAELLRREVMLKEKQRDVEYFTNVYNTLVQRRDSLVTGFVFTKEGQYQDIGNYTVASQALVLNQFNSFLRASVREDGDAYLASYYRGAKIAHKTLKVSTDDGFVICEKPMLSRSYWNYGVYNERREFRYGADDGLMDFIASSTTPLKVQLIGDIGKFEYVLRAEDVVAVKRIIEFSNLLKTLEEAHTMLDEAQRSLDFLIKSQQRSQNN